MPILLPVNVCYTICVDKVSARIEARRTEFGCATGTGPDDIFIGALSPQRIVMGGGVMQPRRQRIELKRVAHKEP